MSNKYKLNFAYEARTEREITLAKDEIITVLKTDESGWAEGVTEGGRQGWFPISFASPYNEAAAMHIQNKALKVAQEKKGGVRRMSTRFLQKKTKTDKGGGGGGNDENLTSGELDLMDDSILGNKAKTATYLSKWIQIRTKPEKLKEKGLIDDYVAPGAIGSRGNTIYGMDLKDVIKTYGGPVPPMIEQCVEFIRANAMKEQGIFRLSGVASEVDNLGKIFFEVGAKPDMSEIDCNAVSGACKKFFRELPEPLFTFDAHEEFLDATQDDDPYPRLKKALETLPRANYLIIFYLLKFLKEVCKYSDVNKMAASNLGIVFGPTLMRNKEESLSGIMNPMNNPAKTISVLIGGFDEVFGTKDPSDLVPSSIPGSDAKTKPDLNANLQANLGDVLRSRSKTGGGPPTTVIEKPPPPKPAAIIPKAPSDDKPPPPKQLQQIGTFARVASFEDKLFKSPVQGISPNIKPPTPSKPSTPAKPMIPVKPTLPVRATQSEEKPPPIPEKPVIPPKPNTAAGEEKPPPIPEKPTLPPKLETCTALYDYAGDASMGQMSFKAGEKIFIKSKHPSGWWTSDSGLLFPSNFVE